jgi:hypothetical protein
MRLGSGEAVQGLVETREGAVVLLVAIGGRELAMMWPLAHVSSPLVHGSSPGLPFSPRRILMWMT